MSWGKGWPAILTQDLDVDVARVLLALLVHGSTDIDSLIQLPTRGRDD